MRKFTLLILLIISSTVFAAGIPWKPQTDEGILGRASSSDPVELFFDVGDGASNPVLSVDKTAKTFDLSKPTRIQGDLTIGDGTPSDRNLVIDEGAGANNPRLTWDTATNKWKQFDGTSERVIGSGSGGAGGQNFFADKNPDAEGGTNNWTVTGTGTFSVFTSTPINGLTSFRWDSDLQNDVLRTDQVAIPEFFKGKSCEINFRYSGLTGSSDLIKPQVVNSSFVKLPGATYRNQVDGTDFLQAQTGIVQRTIFFICPDSGTIALEFLQTAAGDPAIMDFDDVFIGELIGLQTTVVTGAWTSYTPAITGFGTPTGVDFQFRVIGDSVEINGTFTSGTPTAVEAQLSLPNSGAVLSTSVSPITIAGLWIRGVINTNHGGAILITAGDVFINFGSTSTFGSTSVNSMLPVNGNTMASSGDEVVVHATVPIEGQAASPARIFLSIPKVAENENKFSAKVDADAASTTIFSKSADWLQPTPVVRIVLGRYRVDFKTGLFSIAPSCTVTGIGIGGTNRISTIQVPSTTASIEIRITDQTGTLTETDFNIECQRQEGDLKTQTVQPILVNQVETTIANGVRVEACQITNSGTPTTNGAICDGWISSITDDGVGLPTINIIAGIFSGDPSCSCSCEDGTNGCNHRGVASSTTSIPLTTRNSSGTVEDKDFEIICVGKR